MYYLINNCIPLAAIVSPLGLWGLGVWGLGFLNCKSQHRPPDSTLNPKSYTLNLNAKPYTLTPVGFRATVAALGRWKYCAQSTSTLWSSERKSLEVREEVRV